MLVVSPCLTALLVRQAKLQWSQRLREIVSNRQGQLVVHSQVAPMCLAKFFNAKVRLNVLT